MNRTSLKKYKQYTHISFSPSVRYHPTKIQKLKYDNEQFSKEYIQKKNYLEKVNKKETEFLKKILESKKVEKNFHVKPPDPLKMAKEAQNAFTLGLSLAKTNDTRSALQKIIEDTKIHINDIINNKFQCLSTKQLSKKASSVDSKDKFVIKSERQRRRSCEDEVDEKNSLSHNYFKLKKYVPPDLSNSNIVSKLNNDMIKKLNLEYEILSQRGNSLNDKKYIYYSKVLNIKYNKSQDYQFIFFIE
jgi:16S rRNA U1498 N3-methylase RsmE